MNKNTDHFKDLEYITEKFESDGIRAPESLSEDNIFAMLPDKPVTPDASDAGEVNNAADAFRPVKPKKRPAVKKWIAVAACTLIALLGVTQVYDAVTGPPSTELVNGELYTFKNKTEIDRLVDSLSPETNYNYWDGGDILYEDELAVEESSDAAAPSALADGGGEAVRSQAKAATGSSSADHSETYLQVEEVDEADIVKTDGKYIYYVNDAREVVILSAKNGKTKLVSRIGSSEIENYVHDIFLKGNTLVTVGYFYNGDDGYTGIVTYDITDRKNPKVISQFRQTGNIISSRMVGDFVYLVTSEYVYKDGRTIPKVMVDGEFKEMSPDSICCVPDPQQTSYVILGAMDIASGKQAKSKYTAIFGATDDIYCNDHNLYAAAYEWDSNKSTSYTRLVRASLDGLKVKFNATAKIRGSIKDQFSMDEKDGYFRIATTSQRDGIDVNNLFVLDKDLKEVGTLSGFARNESIKSVRYFGEKAYVITYKAIDPLFIIDLKDPTSPKIDGEVKIDGFSTLLVPAGEGRLLGIGHATGDNGYGGEYASGLKLVLFDISDPSEPKVLDSKEFKDMESPAQSEHKALTINSKEGWYAVPYGIWSYPEVDDDVIIEDGDDVIIEDAEAPEIDETWAEDTTEEAETEEDDYGYEAGVLVFGTGDKLKVFDQHKLGKDELLRSVYIGDYIYALDREGNASSFKFTK